MRQGEYRKLGLNVYAVDLSRQKLVQINNLQDHVLFIGFNTPFFLPSKDFPMLTPNSIYLADDYNPGIDCHSSVPRQVVVFNMKDESFTDLLPAANSCLSWPIPIWIRPSC
jgi:hypothetical protein